jgi:hypothetical protein
METIDASETSVTIHRPIWRHNAEVRTYAVHLFTADLLFIQLRTAALRLIVRFWLDVPTFATRRLDTCYHAGAPSGGRWNCGREMSGTFA